MKQTTVTLAPCNPVLDGIVERKEFGTVVLSPANGRPFRRVIYVDSYGGAEMWDKIKHGVWPTHHLRGCFQLARRGYEVALPEPLPDFYFNRRALPHDLRLLKMVRDWLGPDGIVFCGHNVLYWLLVLRRLGLVRSHIVSNLWAREPLNLARAHSGVVGLTRAGVAQAKKLAPDVKVEGLGWGADLSFYPKLSYCPEAFFSCGRTLRDHNTLSRACSLHKYPTCVIASEAGPLLAWPSNVTVMKPRNGWEAISYQELLRTHHGRSIASLIVLKNDPAEYTAVGFTEIIEVLAMARPVIMTRTGALPTEIDIEGAGCGLFVPPDEPAALAEAMRYLGSCPSEAEAMGKKGRQLAESYYNIERYARGLHEFFNSL